MKLSPADQLAFCMPLLCTAEKEDHSILSQDYFWPFFTLFDSVEMDRKQGTESIEPRSPRYVV